MHHVIDRKTQIHTYSLMFNDNGHMPDRPPTHDGVGIPYNVMQSKWQTRTDTTYPTAGAPIAPAPIAPVASANQKLRRCKVTHEVTARCSECDDELWPQTDEERVCDKCKAARCAKPESDEVTVIDEAWDRAHGWHAITIK